MSKIWVTNESSSFARSFSSWCARNERHEFVNCLENDEYDYFRQDTMFRKREVDIFDPTLPTLISRSGAEVIIHQLPITPEISSTHPDYALRNNIEGTHYVIEAAKEIDVPVLFVTSRNYRNIANNFGVDGFLITDIYNITTQTVENLLDISGVKHTSVIPPIIYGPEFDEGITGLIKTAINGKEQVVINLDPEVQHPFMHADDFFNGLGLVIDNLDLEVGRVDKPLIEILPSKNNFISLDKILENLENRGLYLSYDIHPEFDVFADEVKDEENVSSLYKWKQEFNIDTGIENVIDVIREHNDNKRKE